jgi:chitin synthase
MAYHQNHDPYYEQQSNNYHQQYPQANVGYAPDYPPHSASDYDHSSNWDSKSYQSSYAGSQAHINPQYNMSQVSVHQNVPPVPSMPYQQNYPPYGRPTPTRDLSTGYSMAREKLMKRRSVRQVELYQGNLVYDVPVPTAIIPKGMSDMEEMSKMRYTAATCDPDDFMRSRYSLRQYLYGRHTELFIVMTMYNEDEVLFVKTMNAYVLIV